MDPMGWRFRAVARRRQRFYVGETVGVPPKRDPRGSPFQMPARLADGLGPESDRTDGSPPVFAPSPEIYSFLRGIGFPALTRRKAGQLRLQNEGLIAQNRACCQRDPRQVPAHQGNSLKFTECSKHRRTRAFRLGVPPGELPNNNDFLPSIFPKRRMDRGICRRSRRC